MGWMADKTHREGGPQSLTAALACAKEEQGKRRTAVLDSRPVTQSHPPAQPRARPVLPCTSLHISTDTINGKTKQ